LKEKLILLAKDIMMTLLRQGFGLNTNLFETNVLNLAVVLGVVIKVVGDSLRSLLDTRRQTILSTLQEADLKARKAKKRLESAQRTLEEARLRVQEIRIQTVQAIEREESFAQKQLERDLCRLQESVDQAIQLERQQMTQTISYQVSSLALASAEDILLKTLGSQGTVNSKQKELNEVYVRETFCQFKELSFVIFLFVSYMKRYENYFTQKTCFYLTFVYNYTLFFFEDYGQNPSR